MLILVIDFLFSIFDLKVFKNHGPSAGASMSHSHSQMIALPIIPPTVSARIDSMKEHFDRTGKCSLCEVQLDRLQINESIHFVSIAPFASTSPFELWIIPRNHYSHFHELNEEQVTLVFLVVFSELLNFAYFISN